MPHPVTKALLLAAFAAMAALPLRAQTAAIPAPAPVLEIVAAENFYGEIARQLAGGDARITSILSNPDDDPHLFEASPSVARALSSARVVVYNGADYDPWMVKLLRAARAKARVTIVVADLAHRKPGDNPHLWYDTGAIATYGRALSAALVTADPARKADYEQRLQAFLAQLQPLEARIAAMKAKFHGLPVTATEPVFGYMAAALGLAMRNERFQLSIMNDTEPRVSDVAAFETDLKTHKVRALLYNSQATGPAAKRLLDIARQAKIPVVGITETEPAGKSYPDWMIGQLDALEAALSMPAS